MTSVQWNIPAPLGAESRRGSVPPVATAQYSSFLLLDEAAFVYGTRPELFIGYGPAILGPALPDSKGELSQTTLISAPTLWTPTTAFCLTAGFSNLAITSSRYFGKIAFPTLLFAKGSDQPKNGFSVRSGTCSCHWPPWRFRGFVSVFLGLHRGHGPASGMTRRIGTIAHHWAEQPSCITSSL